MHFVQPPLLIIKIKVSRGWMELKPEQVLDNIFFFVNKSFHSKKSCKKNTYEAFLFVF